MPDRRRTLRSLAAIAVFAVLYLLASAMITNSYYQLMMTLVMIWATLGLSWNVLSGYSGLVSFGHAAFFGLGAYTATLLLVHWDVSFWLGIPAATVVGALAGLLIGLPTFRLHGVYFALAMLAYPLALLYVFEWLGYQEVPLPMKREAPLWHMQFDDQRAYGALALGLMIAAMAVSMAIERSRFGMSLLAIKQNELAAEAAGIDTWLWKLRAIMISGAIAGAAGALYAKVLLVVTPLSVFGMLTSAQALIVTLFGGPGTFWGPLIGASILIPLAEVLQGELGHILPGIQGVTLGLAVVLVILLAPEGIYWKVRDRWHARDGRAADAPAPTRATLPPAPAAATRPPRSFGEPLLVVHGLSKRFGGLQALNEVSLTVNEGMILGIIGPNGAGKTTLFNVLNGFAPPSAGSMHFRGHDLAGLKPNRVCRLGIGRTFQVVRSFARMSVLENVLIGAYVAARTDAEAIELARDAIRRVGLQDRAARVVGGLTTSDLRLMELARALASRPALLLMDEPLAGLGHEEIEGLLRAVHRVRDDGVTIVVIEHTMHAMVRLADRMVVLDHGSVIAEGTPDSVTRQPKVIEAYLGKRWMSHAAG